MAKITDPDSLNVGTEITFDLPNKTFTLVAAGNLVAKDGVTGNALWAKFVDLWTSSTYQPYPFPMNVLDARSGQYIFGQDPGGSFNGWKPANDTTRQMIRDAGWSEYSSLGVLNRQYVGVVVGSNAPIGTQFYYQRATGGAALNFTFTDAPNEAIQVYGDTTNGNFDTRTFFKIFLRNYQYTFDSKVLGDIFETGTGAYKIAFGTSTALDTKIQDTDVNVAANTPYTDITVEYFATNQSKTIGGGSYPFRIIVNNTIAGATLEQIYTKIQYLLRQASDIDAGAGTVTGKTAEELMHFVGDTLYTTTGVFIDGVIAADLNRIVFEDQNEVQRQYPYASSGTLSFNSALTFGGTGYYRMYFTTLPGANNDYGESSAVTVNDKDGVAIAGTISSSSLDFTFDYDGNVQAGRTSGTDAAVTIIAGNPGSAKPVVVTGTISRSKGISFTLTAESDRAYIA